MLLNINILPMPSASPFKPFISSQNYVPTKSQAIPYTQQRCTYYINDSLSEYNYGKANSSFNTNTHVGKPFLYHDPYGHINSNPKIP